jgi:hypothetical protein
MSKLALVIASNAKKESRARLDNSEKAEWQEAVDLASALLHLASARPYGLVTGGPVINVGNVSGQRRGDKCKRPTE